MLKLSDIYLHMLTILLCLLMIAICASSFMDGRWVAFHEREGIEAKVIAFGVGMASVVVLVFSLKNLFGGRRNG